DQRVGIGQRLVLAHHAAQLQGERVEACFLGGAMELQRSGIGLLVGLRQRRQRGQPQQRGKQEPVHRAASIFASSASSSFAMSSSVSGPTCFQRTAPAPSTRKVSGAPYTPQSTAVRPSTSETTTMYGLPNCSSQRSASLGSSFQL